MDNLTTRFVVHNVKLSHVVAQGMEMLICLHDAFSQSSILLLFCVAVCGPNTWSGVKTPQNGSTSQPCMSKHLL